MSDPETPTQPLIGAASHETAINVGAPAQSGRSSRAYKVAGLTLLACVLIVGQAMTAYFLLSQKSDIQSLEDQNKKIQTQMTKGSSVSVPMKMHVPMNAMVSTHHLSPPTSDPPATSCQLESAGVKLVQVPGFRPACDERGLYKAQQCYMGHCWCVNTATGEQIPGSELQGEAKCNLPLLRGSMSKVMTLPDVDA
uniref:Thyroglobulin type-1 domain-containing protein n=1 Tax=Amphilophus citrinellus TaxID=61819 RepID=A0A3Q0RWT6_AMPCI